VTLLYKVTESGSEGEVRGAVGGIRVSHGHTAPGNRTDVCRYTNEYAIVGWENLWNWNLSCSGGVVPCAGSGVGRMRASALAEPRRG
jgi:hypothetical protein